MVATHCGPSPEKSSVFLYPAPDHADHVHHAQREQTPAKYLTKGCQFLLKTQVRAQHDSGKRPDVQGGREKARVNDVTAKNKGLNYSPDQSPLGQKGFSALAAATGCFTRNRRPCPRPSTKNVMRSSPNIRWW